MMFVTVWAAILDLSTGKGLACNAGHEHPAIRRAGGVFELVKYRHGTMVGISELSTYQDREFTLGPGDCIFVYTDGVPEASNDVSAMFGEERLTDALNDNAGSAPEELVVRVRRAVDRFADGTPQFDDITMLCVKYFGKELEEGENGNL
jgi:sigma-B regulation protein RsbU (phosphoserine phosphatase)